MGFGNVRFLNELRPLDKSKFLIVASASMVLFDVIDKNNDIDIIFLDDYKKDLYKKHIIEINPFKNKYQILNTHIDCGYTDDEFDYETIKQFGVVSINGYQFLNLAGLLKFYNLLFNQTKKEKFQQRIELISSFLSNKNNNIVFHGTPKQNLTTILPNVSYSYEQKEIVFASQSSIFAKLFGYNWIDDDIKLTSIKNDNIDPLDYTFIMEIKHPLYHTSKPFSVYTLNDSSFKQLLMDKGNGHPVLELISDQQINVITEYQFPSWKDELFQLEKNGKLKLINKENLL